MAINFPSSPTDGQIYVYNGRTWVYRSANTAWAAQATLTPAYYSSTSAPSGVKEGDEWYDESTGIFYRYVYDGNTFQWVEVGPTSIPASASDTAAGAIEIAVQSEMEAASSTTLAVTPGRLIYDPGNVKAWARWNMSGTPALASSRNVSSITDHATGDQTLNWSITFSATTYSVMASGSRGDSVQSGIIGAISVAAGSARIFCKDDSGSAVDSILANAWAVGDL